MTPLTLHLDWTACDGHGLCTELLPELLDRDDWGYPVARADRTTRDLPVPEQLTAHARRAVASCPRLALALARRTPT
jgi:ferredoxin